MSQAIRFQGESTEAYTLVREDTFNPQNLALIDHKNEFTRKVRQPSH